MGMLANLLIADADAADDILKSDNPDSEWEGFNFQGMDNIKFDTLLSILSSNSSKQDYDKWSKSILSKDNNEEGPWLFSFSDNAVKLLSTIAAKEDDEVLSLSNTWAATEEFEGWAKEDILELLRSTGDLAETAILEEKTLFLWISL